MQRGFSIEEEEEEEETGEQPTEEVSFTAKIVMAGCSGVGKTSIINRVFSSKFSTDIRPTVGSGFKKGVLRKNGKKITMEVWDTAGQEQFNSLAPIFFTNAAAAVLVYDITDYNSFKMLDTYVQMVNDKANPNCVIAIVGNKYDLICQNESMRKVPLSEAEAFSESIGTSIFLEVSAKTGQSVNSIFELIAEDPNLHNVEKPINLNISTPDPNPKKTKGCKC